MHTGYGNALKNRVGGDTKKSRYKPTRFTTIFSSQQHKNSPSNKLYTTGYQANAVNLLAPLLSVA
jgi:hypothetical protein